MKNKTNSKKRVIRLSPFFVFLSLLLALGSCKKEAKLGIETRPENDLIGITGIDTFQVIAKTVAGDTLRTDERSTLLLGIYKDPIFGTVSSELYTQFEPSIPVNFGDPNKLTLDSVVLMFRFDVGASGSYGKLLGQGNLVLPPLTFRAYELNEKLNIDSSYTHIRKADYNPQIIGEAIEYRAVLDSINVGNGRAPAQFRMRLDNAWGEKILKAPSSTFQNAANFQELVKGLAIIPTLSFNSEGNIYYFVPQNAFTALRLYYKVETESGNFNSETYDLLIGSSSANYMRYQISRNGSPVEQAIQNPSIGAEKCYIQGMGGCYTELSFPTLMQAFENQNIVVNRAELVMPLENTGATEYPEVPSLFIKAYDENRTKFFIVDQLEGANHIDGFVDRTNNQYRFVITRHVQNMISAYRRGENFNFGFVLTPTSESIQANRVVVQGHSPTAGERIKLRILYTPL